MSKTEQQNINRALARAIRSVVKAESLDARIYQPNGPLWERAKRVLKAGASIDQAAWHAVHAESQARVDAIVAPVAHVPAPARKLNAQQERVRRGEVMRDTQGRILSRDVQEAFETLTALSHA